MKTAWLTGSNGLIGNYIVRWAPQFGPQWRLRALTRAQFDLLDFASVEREFKTDRPELIIHCAGISGVADAQKNPAQAKKVNTDVTQLLAELASDVQFVFFSTDLVFDGRKGNYNESDAPNPLHTYGETKVAAEQIVLKNPAHLVLRTSINGGISAAGNRGFNEQLWQALESGRTMKLFTDEFRCPIFAGETARAVWELTEQKCSGIVHVAGAERMSRFQLGQLLLRHRPHKKDGIEPGLAKDFPGPPRVPDASLDISKAQTLLAKPLPSLTEWLAANPTEPF
ncbi:MAG TPA: SDR family oxidoreductase [Verrucomicrobiae bacterium]|jgi:dTDP-4-dehydrorhamnose reductase|nr:SDR family oxidoreductase [Verrucomicrobiae bacterium]